MFQGRVDFSSSCLLNDIWYFAYQRVVGKLNIERVYIGCRCEGEKDPVYKKRCVDLLGKVTINQETVLMMHLFRERKNLVKRLKNKRRFLTRSGFLLINSTLNSTSYVHPPRNSSSDYLRIFFFKHFSCLL